MSLSRAWTASWNCFMFGLLEIFYPGCVLINFCCDPDNKNLDFLHFSILADISVLLILANQFSNIVMQLQFYLLGMLTGSKKCVSRIVFIFSFLFSKIPNGRQIICYSQELDRLTDLLQGSVNYRLIYR